MLARWGLLFGLLALGVAMVFSAWNDRREARKLSALLDRAQAERFFRSIPELHERNRGPATSRDLSALLDRSKTEGLRYLVEYDRFGRVVAEAGSRIGSARPTPADVSGLPTVIGDRVRVTFIPPRTPTQPGQLHPSPPPPPLNDEPGDQSQPRSPSARPPPPPSGGMLALPDLVLEFEPTVATELRTRATRSFAFSVTAAASLLALTLGLWLAAAREERRRERSERERQLAALGEMSAVLAHEIRNPLASLKGHAQLLGEQLGSDEKLQKKVQRIVGEALRLEELTNTLLDLVRSSSISLRDVDPAKLAREVAEAIDATRVEVDTRHAPTIWSLDPMRMEQVLKNLLQNALQASPPDATVELSLASDRGRLVLTVRDHGTGLVPGSERQVFEPFRTSRAKGTGLGLAVARRIVELHGGQIHGENHPQGGALFTVRIP